MILNMQQKFLFKTGSNFYRNFRLMQVDPVTKNRVPLDLTDVRMSSEVMDSDGNIFASFQIEKADQQTSAGVFALVYSASTAGWPLGLARTDILINDVHTMTIEFEIERGITRIEQP